MYLGMNWTEAFRNVSKIKKKIYGEEIRRSVEGNSFRNIVKIKRKYATIISGLCIFTKIHYVQFGKIFDICHILYVELFIRQKSYQVVYNVSHIFVQYTWIYVYVLRRNKKLQKKKNSTKLYSIIYVKQVT